MSGWIKLHRSLVKWEWFTDVNTTHLFTYLLLSANHIITKWRGKTILPGQLLTGRKKLAAATGLSIQNVRTSIDRLQVTSEITIKSYSNCSVITITNWSSYQDANHQSNHEVTRDLTTIQPSSNHQVTTSKNVKNENNVESSSPFSFFELSEEGIIFAETSRGMQGDLLQKCWVKFQLHHDGKPKTDGMKKWKKWVMDEHMPETPDKPLTGHDKKIQMLGAANWKRKRKMHLDADQVKLLKEYENDNGEVTWENLKEYKTK